MRRALTVVTLCLAVLAPVVLLGGTELAGSVGLARTPDTPRITPPQITLHVLKHGFITNPLSPLCSDLVSAWDPGGMCVEIKAVLKLNGYVIPDPSINLSQTGDIATGNAYVYGDAGGSCFNTSRRHS